MKLMEIHYEQKGSEGKMRYPKGFVLSAASRSAIAKTWLKSRLPGNCVGPRRRRLYSQSSPSCTHRRSVASPLRTGSNSILPSSAASRTS